jgi:hypothetical protein
MAGQVFSQAVAAAAGKGYWREADARPVVKAWERSGEPLSRFAATRGLKVARLARWASRLGSRAVGRRGRSGSGATPLKLRFHPVDLVGSTAALGTTAIEVVLLDGRRVRVPPGFATNDLERVLQVLEERRRC